jgi:hypothetical protein
MVIDDKRTCLTKRTLELYKYNTKSTKIYNFFLVLNYYFYNITTKPLRQLSFKWTMKSTPHLSLGPCTHFAASIFFFLRLREIQNFAQIQMKAGATHQVVLGGAVVQNRSESWSRVLTLGKKPSTR